MLGTTTTTSSSSSSSSSCASFGSFDDVSVKPGSGTVKFVCSYGGKILPRHPDGKLRYVGGETRVLAVDRSVPFPELQAKMGELCGWGAPSLRCQLPTEDLDALVSVTSDEDLANLIEEYDLAGRDRLSPLKIRAFLFPSTTSPPPPRAPTSTSPPPPSLKGKRSSRPPVPGGCVHQIAATARHPGRIERFAGNPVLQGDHRACLPKGTARGHQYLVHHGSHWQ